MDGKLISKIERKVEVKANSSNKILSENTEVIIKSAARNDVVINVELIADKSYTNNYVLVKHKDIDYPKVNIKTNIKVEPEGYGVSLTSDKFARAVFVSIDGIDNFFSDNYFDILPGQIITITVKTNISERDFRKQLQIVSLADMY